MQIPTELLIEIASNLIAQDLSNFRLISKRFASAGLGLIPSNGLSVMNIAGDLKDCRELVKCRSIAQNVRHLRLFHAEWPPACSKLEWERHPLLFGGNDRFNVGGLDALEVEKSKSAFAAYTTFKREEETWRGADDVVCLFNILRSLPNLKSFEISHMQNCVWRPATNSRYHRLLKRIWVAPYLVNDISPAVEMSLLALGNGFPNLQRFDVLGTLNPKVMGLRLPAQFGHIQRLSVNTFRLMDNEDSVRDFLSLFPNLTHLRLNFQGFAPSVDLIGSLSWSSLRYLHLNGMWTSEYEYLEIFKQHQGSLQEFIIGNSALTQGSWKSLFTRIRSMRCPTLVTAEGELYGRSNRETLNMHPEDVMLLRLYMQDLKAPWPFKPLQVV
ncbi:hypothetical protein B0J14DRAFT_568447 [Halenospora varia]|nr:hypothetical protein B0J14DRAFT_568447 [Halenospora varia]